MERRHPFCINDVKKVEPYIQEGGGGYSFFQKEKNICCSHSSLKELYAPKCTLGAGLANTFAGMMTPAGGSGMCL